MSLPHVPYSFFFFNDTATTEIYTLSLHDALPICMARSQRRYLTRLTICARSRVRIRWPWIRTSGCTRRTSAQPARSEEHTSELQSPCNLVCRLLLEKKKKQVPQYECERRTVARQS